MFNLTYKSVDVMKKTKDTVTSQLSTTEKTDLVNRIKTMGVTHIAISTPMDTNAQFIANSTTPSPRTIEAETQDWFDVIHTAGLKVIFRGTFCAVENIWNFAYDGGSTPIGSVASAPTDGESTWSGKIVRFITTNVGASHWQSGDIFAPIAEPSTHAFDGHLFCGNQTNFNTFFTNLPTVATNAFTSIGVSGVLVGHTHNNYSEIISGWISQGVFDAQGIVGFDYYGQYQGTTFNRPQDYVTDLNNISSKGTLFQGEWGDLPNSMPASVVTIYDRLSFLINFYKQYRDNEVDTNKLVGFNYWGGWEGQDTSLLYKDSNGKYQLNARGKILASFFKSSGGSVRVPVITSGSDIGSYTY